MIVVYVIISLVAGAFGGVMAGLFLEAWFRSEEYRTPVEPEAEKCGELFRAEGSIGPWSVCDLEWEHDGGHCDGETCLDPHHEPQALVPWLLVAVDDANETDYISAAQRRESMGGLTPAEFEKENERA